MGVLFCSVLFCYRFFSISKTGNGIVAAQSVGFGIDGLCGWVGR